MNKEQKKAIEYLKTRLYGNEGCKYIDIAQEDLRIFINLIDSLQKENEELIKNLELYNIQGSNIKLEIYIKDNFIEKKKIKNKIEELKQKALIYKPFIYKEESFSIESKISILEELLEGDN